MKKIWVFSLLIGSLLMLGCNSDDPKPVNEEELITTVRVILESEQTAETVELLFFDEDGEAGSIAPVITVEGKLKAGQTYTALISLLNETVEPALDVTEEISEEAADHLFCFEVDGDIVITARDQDENGLPLGLVTEWQVGDPGPASVTLLLRHQQDTKTGECPGGGDTDIEVTFDLIIE